MYLPFRQYLHSYPNNTLITIQNCLYNSDRLITINVGPSTRNVFLIYICTILVLFLECRESDIKKTINMCPQMALILAHGFEAPRIKICSMRNSYVRKLHSMTKRLRKCYATKKICTIYFVMAWYLPQLNCNGSK